MRLQLAEVLATECARCGHPLKEHATTMQSDKNACKHWDVIPHPKGYPAGNATFKYCKCRDWVDVGDQLALQPKDANG